MKHSLEFWVGFHNKLKCAEPFPGILPIQFLFVILFFLFVCLGSDDVTLQSFLFFHRKCPRYSNTCFIF